MVRSFGLALTFTFLCAVASASKDTICSVKFSKFARDVRNPQIQIWELREANRTESVHRLERATRKLLQNGKADPIGYQAVDAPVILELEGGIRGVWKKISNRTRREVVAYKFDRMIDAKFVNEPQTLRLFDFLIAHDDRHGGNILSHRGRTIAIDNEGTFLSTTLTPIRAPPILRKSSKRS